MTASSQFTCGSICLIAWLSPLPAAWGGWGYTYTNQAAVSPSRAYRFTAIGREDSGSLEDFVYSMRDRQTGRVVWTRKQADNESPPDALFVADDGRSVIWLGPFCGDGPLLVCEADGRCTARLDIFKDLFTPAERDKYVWQGSSGPHWGKHHAYVVSQGQTSLFVIRTGWDRRIVLDLRQGRPTPVSPATEKLLDATETKYVLATLQEFAAAVSDDFDFEDGQYDRVCVAVYMAGRLQIRDAVQSLRRIEAVWLPMTYRDLNGLPQTADVTGAESSLRQIAQDALRRLGERPRPLPIIRLQNYRTHEYLTPREISLPKPRDQQADLLSAGMTSGKVLELLGPPDRAGILAPSSASEGRVDGWRYDLDAAKPCSLILGLEDGRLTRIIRLTPALWQTADRIEEWHDGLGYDAPELQEEAKATR